MNEYSMEILKRLQSSAENACRFVYRNRQGIDDAVNWADLHCHEAKWTINDDGISWYSVVVEECSPNADKLRAAISQFLEQDGFSDIVVETEW